MGTQGSATGQFSSPNDLIIRGDVVYVSDENNHRVQKLSIAEKAYIAHFGEKGSGDGQLSSLHPEGKVFVADYGNNRVQVFRADGTFTYSITGNTSDGSTFSSPWGLAFDPNGNLHIVASGSNLVKIFTKDGKYISEYGRGYLYSPSGIAIDRKVTQLLQTFQLHNVLLIITIGYLIHSINISTQLI